MVALKLYQVSELQGCCSKRGHLEIYRGTLGIPLSPESCWIAKGLWHPLWYIGAPSFLDAPKSFPCADEMQSTMSRDLWLGWRIHLCLSSVLESLWWWHILRMGIYDIDHPRNTFSLRERYVKMHNCNYLVSDSCACCFPFSL